MAVSGWFSSGHGGLGEPFWIYRALAFLSLVGSFGAAGVCLAVIGLRRCFGSSLGLFRRLLSWLITGFHVELSFVEGGQFLHRKPGSCRSVYRSCLGAWTFGVLLLSLLRIGEASHPGPDSPVTWRLGVANPSGLNGKVDQVAALDGDVWVMTETHLSQHGLSRFKQGLHALATPWKYVVPGSPCPVRGLNATGTHSGVLLLSRFPARAVSHSFDLDLYASARMQVAGVAVQGVWVTVGMLYGSLAMPVTSKPSFRPRVCWQTSLIELPFNQQGPA